VGTETRRILSGALADDFPRALHAGDAPPAPLVPGERQVELLQKHTLALQNRLKLIAVRYGTAVQALLRENPVTAWAPPLDRSITDVQTRLAAPAALVKESDHAELETRVENIERGVALYETYTPGAAEALRRARERIGAVQQTFGVPTRQRPLSIPLWLRFPQRSGY
jgi:hypothetical protein